MKAQNPNAVVESLESRLCLSSTVVGGAVLAGTHMVRADFNGDGRVDAVSTVRGHGLTISQRKANGRLARPVPIAGATFARGAAIGAADFDGDGNLDLVVYGGKGVSASASGQFISVSDQAAQFLNPNPAGNIDDPALHVDPILGGMGAGLGGVGGLGGFDGTSTMGQIPSDLINPSFGAFNNPVSLTDFSGLLSPTPLLNNPQTQLIQPVASNPTGINISRRTAGVLTRGGLFVLFGQGDGDFGSPQQVGGGGVLAGSAASRIQVQDFNSDGFADILIARRRGGRFGQLVLGNGDGTFLDVRSVALP